MAKVTANIEAATLKIVLPSRIVTNNLRGYSSNARIYLFSKPFPSLSSFK